MLTVSLGAVGERGVVMFYVQAFCFLIFQFTEDTFVLLLKTKKSFSQGSSQTAGPHPNKGLALGRACTPAQRGSTCTAPVPCPEEPQAGDAMPRNTRGERTAPEPLEKVQTPPSTQVASPGNTRTPRDASPGQNPISTEVEVRQLHRHSTKPLLKKIIIIATWVYVPCI